MPYSSVLLCLSSSSQKIRICSRSLPMMIITNAGSTNTAHHHWQLSLVSALWREGAWVTRPERPKGAKDEVKGPEGPPTRSRGPEGP